MVCNDNTHLSSCRQVCICFFSCTLIGTCFCFCHFDVLSHNMYCTVTLRKVIQRRLCCGQRGFSVYLAYQSPVKLVSFESLTRGFASLLCYGVHELLNMAPPPTSTISLFLVLVLLALPYLVTSTFNASARFDTIYDAIPELAPLRDSPGLKRPPSVGGQNFGTCCLKAVAKTYIIQNQQVSGPRTPPGLQGPFLNLPPEEFNNSQFPCGAKFGDGIDSKGAPQVTVPYTWCRDHCGGWERSSNANLGQWVQPFVGFILPSTVFCLNVSISLLFFNCFGGVLLLEWR